MAIYHDYGRRILIQSFNRKLEDVVRMLPGCQWSQSLKGWHVENNPGNLSLMFRTFKDIIH